MLLTAKSGIRGRWINLNTGKILRKVIWGNLSTGEFEAYRIDGNGEICRDEFGKPLSYKGKVRLHFTATANLGKKSVVAPTEPQKPITRLRTKRRIIRKLQVPLFNVFCDECSRLAAWLVSDEVDLPPVIHAGRRYMQARTVGIRYYCSWCYKPPRLLDSKGEIIKEFSDAGGIRPQWHS